MKAMSVKQGRGLTRLSMCTCADNSGAKEVYIISVFGHRTRKRMSPKAGIGDLVNVVVKKGKPEMRKKIERAVIIRSKMGLRRANGLTVKFEDNAVVLVDDKGVPKATEVKGYVAKEVGDRFPKVLGLATQIA
ncbi:MAG: uL14 family ribosomal protein [archaeon]